MKDKQPIEVYVPIDVNDRLPIDKNCYHLEWCDKDDATILGQGIFAFFNPNEFDISDEDDENPANPRGAQPTHWLEKQTLYTLTKEEWDERNALVEKAFKSVFIWKNPSDAADFAWQQFQIENNLTND
jgi:hypothetical protein